jgi:hypothetical protein
MISRSKQAGEGAATSHVISLKERAKLVRKEAYARAKEARKNDPRLIALKQKAKEQRRAAYRVAKEAHKARVARDKARDAAAQQEGRAKQRAKMDSVRAEMEGFQAEADQWLAAIRNLLTPAQQAKFDALPKPQLSRRGPPRQ